MITIKNLTKSYQSGSQALRGIDLDIQPTGMFGLLGVNGAGKTTLMRIMAGLLSPTSGQVIVFGNDIATEQGKYQTKAHLGYLPQELGLYPNLTAREFLDYVAILKGITRQTIRQQEVADVLDMVRLTDVANQAIKTFSGGMKRRVGIAQALLGKPQLLIVDEPTVGLDPEERIRLRNLFADMAQRCTVILSTHIVEDISQSCNDLAVLHHGKVLYRGSPRDLITQARGKVWNVSSQDGERPNHGLQVISTLQLQNGIQYRVIGESAADYNGLPAEPSLEDGYMWLMHQANN